MDAYDVRSLPEEELVVFVTSTTGQVILSVLNHGPVGELTSAQRHCVLLFQHACQFKSITHCYTATYLYIYIYSHAGRAAKQHACLLAIFAPQESAC